MNVLLFILDSESKDSSIKFPRPDKNGNLPESIFLSCYKNSNLNEVVQWIRAFAIIPENFYAVFDVNCSKTLTTRRELEFKKTFQRFKVIFTHQNKKNIYVPAHLKAYKNYSDLVIAA